MLKYTFPFVDSCQPHTVTLPTGRFLFELWGASGGSTRYASGGKGAFVSGILNVRNKIKIYVYIGGQGADGSYSIERTRASCNGGASGGNAISTKYLSGASGGGSTDIRINESIESRILVAAGGGGACHGYKGGNAGELSSDDAKGYYPSFSKGANQTNGFLKLEGEPGRSGTHSSNGAEGNGGGGGGYFGGFSKQESGNFTNAPGAGGSSFISGYHNIPITDFYVWKPVMIGGGRSMKKADDTTSYEVGHTGNGFATITKIGDFVTINSSIINIHLFMLFMIFLSK